jgi:hypothetical protein
MARLKNTTRAIFDRLPGKPVHRCTDLLDKFVLVESLTAQVGQAIGLRAPGLP